MEGSGSWEKIIKICLRDWNNTWHFSGIRCLSLEKGLAATLLFFLQVWALTTNLQPQCPASESNIFSLLSRSHDSHILHNFYIFAFSITTLTILAIYFFPNSHKQLWGKSFSKNSTDLYWRAATSKMYFPCHYGDIL